MMTYLAVYNSAHFLSLGILRPECGNTLVEFYASEFHQVAIQVWSTILSAHLQRSPCYVGLCNMSSYFI